VKTLLLALACLGTIPLGTIPLAGTTLRPTPARRGCTLRGLDPASAARLRPILREMASDGTYGEEFLEDAVWMLRHRLAREGFSRASVDLYLHRDGKLLFSAHVPATAPAEFSAVPDGDGVLLRMAPGRRDVFSSLRCNGIHSLDRRQCQRAFYPKDGLISPPGERFFSENRLADGIQRLQRLLRSRGFRDARLLGQRVEERGHRRRVVLDWDEGPPHRIASVRVDWIGEAGKPPGAGEGEWKNLGDGWEEEAPPLASDEAIGERLQRMRRLLHAAGHGDARLDHRLEALESSPERQLDRLVIAVDAGPALRIGAIGVLGKPWDAIPTVRRHLTIRPGDPFDPDAIAANRSRLQSLDLAGPLELRWEDGPDGVRSVHFVGREKGRDEIFLRLGGGSYDLVRCGIDWQHRSLRNLPHSSLLRLVQSCRRSTVTYRGQIPWLCGEGTFFSWHSHLLRMEEAGWIRRDGELGCGLEKYGAGGRHDAFTYSWSRLSADHSGQDWQRRRGRVGSLRLSLERSRLDNPLYPARGSRRECHLELANPIFGGRAKYLRLELAAALHHRLLPTVLLHGDLRLGLAHPFGDADGKLPFNRRFFPGGANSVRGFREGLAAPRDGAGRVVGATAYAIVRGEWEQRLTHRISYFLFCDGVGFCESGHRPDTYLSSSGCGLAFHTFVGPLRLSHSWNWLRRPADPATLLRFSIGFPF
jgi:outer membrane translocation and assembly module TamA